MDRYGGDVLVLANPARHVSTGLRSVILLLLLRRRRLLLLNFNHIVKSGAMAWQGVNHAQNGEAALVASQQAVASGDGRAPQLQDSPVWCAPGTSPQQPIMTLTMPGLPSSESNL